MSASPVLFSPVTHNATRRQMSLLVPPLASLIFLSGFAVAQIFGPNCRSSWNWVCILSFLQRILRPLPDPVQTYNSLGQDPCTVAAYMLSTCSGGSELFVCMSVLHRQTLLSPFFPAFTISPLQPGMEYFGPTALEEANLCLCSTVGYSLASACGGCQQGEWISCDSHCCSLLNSPGLFMCH